MGTGSGRRGRRDNGLVAAEYAVAGDVDPRIGEHLLDVLAAGGIAAYLQPAADLHPVTRTTTLPSRPADRLYVDRDHLDTARDYLAQLTESVPTDGDGDGDGDGGGGGATGEPAAGGVAGVGAAGARDASGGAGGTGTAADPLDVDAEFARIVAGFDRDLDDRNLDRGNFDDRDPDGRDPDGRSPDLGRSDDRNPDDRNPDDRNPDGRDTDGRDADRRVRADRYADPAQRSLLDALDTFGADLPDDEEDSYVPPPPPPLPRLSAAAVVSLLAVVAGFALFLWPDLLPLHADLVRMLGFVGCAGGVLGLIWRLRPGDADDEDFDPDDGARV